MFGLDLMVKGRKWLIVVLIEQIAHNLKDNRHKKSKLTFPKDSLKHQSNSSRKICYVIPNPIETVVIHTRFN